MRLNRFYSERQNLRVGSSVKLPDSDISHIRKVLRLQKGDKIIIFNGQNEYSAELTLVTREFILAKIKELLKSEKESDNKNSFTLFQGLLRAGKIDLIIEKLTEVGVQNIVPVECEFSQTKAISVTSKVPRWNKVAVAAAKQSERITLPEVLNPIKFSDLKIVSKEFDKILFFTIARKNIKESIEAKELNLESIKGCKNIAIVIGPEGGFSPGEHKLAKELGFEFVKCGENILRSETAAIVFSGIVKFLLDQSN